MKFSCRSWFLSLSLAFFCCPFVHAGVDEAFLESKHLSSWGEKAEFYRERVLEVKKDQRSTKSELEKFNDSNDSDYGSPSASLFRPQIQRRLSNLADDIEVYERLAGEYGNLGRYEAKVAQLTKDQGNMKPLSLVQQVMEWRRFLSEKAAAYETHQGSSNVMESLLGDRMPHHYRSILSRLDSFPEEFSDIQRYSKEMKKHFIAKAGGAPSQKIFDEWKRLLTFKLGACLEMDPKSNEPLTRAYVALLFHVEKKRRSLVSASTLLMKKTYSAE